METNLFNQAFERSVIENESNETLWQLAQKKLGGDGDAPLTTDAVLALALQHDVGLVPMGEQWRAFDYCDITTTAADINESPVRAIMMCFLMMVKVSNG